MTESKIDSTTSSSLHFILCQRL